MDSNNLVVYQVTNCDNSLYFLYSQSAMDWLEKNGGVLSIHHSHGDSFMYKSAILQEKMVVLYQVEINDIPLFYFLSKKQAVSTCHDLLSNPYVQIREVLYSNTSDTYKKAKCMSETLHVSVSFLHRITPL
jgi:hypothetical protein